MYTMCQGVCGDLKTGFRRLLFSRHHQLLKVTFNFLLSAFYSSMLSYLSAADGNAPDFSFQK